MSKEEKEKYKEKKKDWKKEDEEQEKYDRRKWEERSEEKTQEAGENFKYDDLNYDEEADFYDDDENGIEKENEGKEKTPEWKKEDEENENFESEQEYVKEHYVELEEEEVESRVDAWLIHNYKFYKNDLDDIAFKLKEQMKRDKLWETLREVLRKKWLNRREKAAWGGDYASTRHTEDEWYWVLITTDPTLLWLEKYRWDVLDKKEEGWEDKIIFFRKWMTRRRLMMVEKLENYLILNKALCDMWIKKIQGQREELLSRRRYNKWDPELRQWKNVKEGYISHKEGKYFKNKFRDRGPLTPEQEEEKKKLDFIVNEMIAGLEKRRAREEVRMENALRNYRKDDENRYQFLKDYFTWNEDNYKRKIDYLTAGHFWWEDCVDEAEIQNIRWGRKDSYRWWEKKVRWWDDYVGEDDEEEEGEIKIHRWFWWLIEEKEKKEKEEKKKEKEEKKTKEKWNKRRYENGNGAGSNRFWSWSEDEEPSWSEEPNREYEERRGGFDIRDIFEYDEEKGVVVIKDIKEVKDMFERELRKLMREMWEKNRKAKRKGEEKGEEKGEGKGEGIQFSRMILNKGTINLMRIVEIELEKEFERNKKAWENNKRWSKLRAEVWGRDKWSGKGWWKWRRKKSLEELQEEIKKSKKRREVEEKMKNQKGWEKWRRKKRWEELQEEIKKSKKKREEFEKMKNQKEEEEKKKKREEEEKKKKQEEEERMKKQEEKKKKREERIKEWKSSIEMVHYGLSIWKQCSGILFFYEWV